MVAGPARYTDQPSDPAADPCHSLLMMAKPEVMISTRMVVAAYAWAWVGVAAMAPTSRNRADMLRDTENMSSRYVKKWPAAMTDTHQRHVC